MLQKNGKAPSPKPQEKKAPRKEPGLGIWNLGLWTFFYTIIYLLNVKY